MPVAVAPRSVSPFLRRGLIGFGVALVILAPLVLALLMLETSPRVADPGPPDAEAAQRARDVAESLRALVRTDDASGTWSASETQMNAVLAIGQRLAPGVFGLAHVGTDALTLNVSAGAPLLPRGLWVNLHLAVAPSEEGLRLASARIGHLPVPPALVLRGMRLVLDTALGDGLGTAAVDSVAAVRLAPPNLTIAIGADQAAREALFRRVRTRVLDAAGTTARERAYVQLDHMHDLARHGRLPWAGSVLPYIKEAVRFASEPSSNPDREELRAALYALALYCGDEEFGSIIAVELEAGMRDAGSGCDIPTLAGRDDHKRHFVISAGLYAATTGSAAVGIGEVKELLDSSLDNPDGGGFGFDDIAANMAGERFAALFLAAPRSAWPAMLARIRTDDDLMPSVEGLPTGLGEVEFRRRYGSIGSPAYAAEIAEVQRRIDALPLYAGALSY